MYFPMPRRQVLSLIGLSPALSPIAQRQRQPSTLDIPAIGQWIVSSRLDGPKWLPDGGILTVEGAPFVTQTFCSTVDPMWGGKRTGRPRADGTFQFFEWVPLRAGRFSGKRLAVLGDSIVMDGGSADSIAFHLARIACAECLNCGLGGTGWGAVAVGEGASQFDAMCLHSIAECFQRRDASVVVDAASQLNTLSAGRWDYRWNAANVSDIVANTPDALLIMAGTNDFGRSLPISEFISAMTTALGKIVTSMPKTEVVLLTPLYRASMPVNKLGLRIEAYAEAISNSAQKFHLKKVDLLHTSGVSELTAAARLLDGTHPSSEYRASLSRHIAACL